MNPDLFLREILSYRMQAVDTLNLAIRLRTKWDDPPPMGIVIHKKLTIEGNLNAFTNPAIEAGVVHCRALLEFLGLCMSTGGRLGNIKKRRNGDVGIEDFVTPGDDRLPIVKPEEALSRYDGDRAEAENALLAVFHIANKGVAHLTEDLIENPEHERLIEIASRGVPSLIISHLYTPLGLTAPSYKLKSRLRES